MPDFIRVASKGLAKALTATTITLLVGALASTAAQADEYPSKPIRLIVGFPGITETAARLVGDIIAQQTGKTVIVDPRPGASSMIAAQYVSKQPADGYTVLWTTNSTMVGNPLIFKSVPYQAKDFLPVSGVSKGANVFVVPPSLGVHSIAELINLAKAHPGKLKFGWAGTSGRASVELLNILYDLKIENVPYKGGPDGMKDLVAGRIDLMVVEMMSGQSFIKSGELNGLAVTSSARVPVAPDLPTMSEAGVKDYELTYWIASYLPAGSAPETVAALNAIITRAVSTERFKDFISRQGGTAFPTTPEDLKKFQETETEKWRKIVQATGMAE